MAAKLSDQHRSDAVELYLSGLSAAGVATAMGVSVPWVLRTVRAAGAVRGLSDASKASYRTGARTAPRARADVLDGEIQRRYDAGEGSPEIARSLGVNPSSVQKRLKAMGVRLRTVAEARLLLHREESSAAVAESRSRKVGWGEDLVRQWLVDCGEHPDTQVPVGSRNLDLAVHTVAVEVWLSSSSPLSDSYCRERIKYLSDRGWASCYIWVSRRTRVLVPTVANQVILLLKHLRAHPSAPREHWVIRGCSELAAIAGDDLDHGPLIPPSKACPHHSTVNKGVSG